MPHPIYHSPRWRALRRRHLARHPRCARCGRPAPVGQSLHVDHVVPHRTAPARAFDPTNLQTLCRQCHATHKRAIERRGYSDDVGLDGWPVDRNHPILNRGQ